jgi:hypothetical protein
VFYQVYVKDEYPMLISFSNIREGSLVVWCTVFCLVYKLKAYCALHIYHILVDRRRHLSVLDVQSFRTADCNTDHYLVVAKFRERLAVNKQSSQRFQMERFNLKKLNEVESKDQYHVEVSNRFAALADLDTEVEMSSACEMIRETDQTELWNCNRNEYQKQKNVSVE